MPTASQPQDARPTYLAYFAHAQRAAGLLFTPMHCGGVR